MALKIDQILSLCSHESSAELHWEDDNKNREFASEMNVTLEDIH